jgi:hypothetical protein
LPTSSRPGVEIGVISLIDKQTIVPLYQAAKVQKDELFTGID